MGGQSRKSTKKFEKNRLKGIIEQRKEVAKVKQRQQLKAKKKARKAQDEERAVDEDGDGDSKLQRRKVEEDGVRNTLKNMSVDDFFQNAFDIPEPQRKKNDAGRKKNKRKLEEVDNSALDGSDSESFDEQKMIASDISAGSEAESNSEDHKVDLEALAEKDPEFYKYLQENDAELLDFDDEQGLAQLSEDDEPPKKKVKPSSKKTKAEEDGEASEQDDNDASASKSVSLASISKWKAAMTEQYSLRAMREVMIAFRAAAYSNEGDEKHFKYSIPSSEVYHELLLTTLQCVPLVLAHHMPIKEMASGKVRVPTDSRKYQTLSALLNSHALAVLSLLQDLSDSSTLKLTLASLFPLLPYLLSFKKALKNLLKAVVDIWSDPPNTEATRINAFILIRRLAVIGDTSLVEVVLKATYQGLLKGCRNTTVHTLPGINLMKNSAAELWGLDTNLGYTTGFTYIRQLAIHLRGSIAQPSKDSYKAIYNWQYTHSLDFWSRVLSMHCSVTSNPNLKKSSDSPLHPLIYPLVQITLGALRLIPTPIYFPLRFHLTRSLLRVSRSTNTYIPLAPALLEVLQSPELKEPPKPSTLKPLDFSVSLRAPKSYLRTRIYQDGVGEQVTDLLAEFFGIWAKSIAFPELSIPPSVLMKRWVKEVSSPPGKGKSHGGIKGNKNHKLNSSVTLLLQKIAANVQFVEKRRSKVDFAVSNKKAVEGFLKEVEWEDLPMGAFVVGLGKQREEKERLMALSREEDEQGRREGKDKEAEDEERVFEGEGDNMEESDED